MSAVFGSRGPRHPWLGAAGGAVARPILRHVFARRGMLTADSRYARSRGAALRDRLARGDAVFLLGIGAAGHNSGVSLVEASRAHGVRLLSNHEEERFTGEKHCAGFPQQSLAALREQMAALGLRPTDLHACLASWDYVELCAGSLRAMLEEAPASLRLLHPDASPHMNARHALAALRAPARLKAALGLEKTLPIIGLRHHDNHACLSWAASPFARGHDPTLVVVLDGAGDDASISLYVARDRRLSLVRHNRSLYDSLGILYTMVSSTQGGWTSLSSEGRYMGASAWGDGDRLTNPYYRRLRQLVYFGAEGEVQLNRALCNWHRAGELEPYNAELADILGPPIPRERMWNPDHVLNVDDVRHPEATRDRVDKAAALQLLFEDALFHVVDHLVRTTGASQLVLTGGSALNCVANMRLLERFDEAWYARNLGRRARLQLWVPPVPGDAGAAAGAAFHFALSHDAPLGPPLRHAFYCGPRYRAADIRAALGGDELGHHVVGDVNDEPGREAVADLLAHLVANDAVVGLFQGVAETGPRALGHRSVLANPAHPRAREVLNELVKFRERVRPLAPMVTREDAARWFELDPGAAADDFAAYDYMVLTARAQLRTRMALPAIVHQDGTSRLQIVRREVDPFVHAYLRAMGRRIGAEVSINTSLNVGSPIVQTPAQALAALKRSRGMDGLLFIGANGEAFLAWHAVVAAPKDAGARLLSLLQSWRAGAEVTRAG